MAIPYDISQAMIQCFGRCFRYKDGVAAFMRQAGVSQQLIDKYRNEPKFVWARHVISDLNQTERGHDVLRRLLTELCKLRKVPDENVPDRDAARDALRELKDLAVSHDLYAEEKKSAGSQRQELAKQRERIVKERSANLEALQRSFSEGLTNPDRQAAGYALEDLLRELFSLYGIEYRKPYKTAVDRRLDQEYIFARYWNHPEDQIESWRHGSAMCCEVLVPDRLPPEFILGVYVSCADTASEVRERFPDLDVVVNSSLFFR